MSKTTIASYERGDSEPTASVLAAYKSKYGVSVNWVIIGEGEMFDESSMVPTDPLDADLLEKVARIVTAVHRDAGIKIAPEKVSVEAAQLYNELMSRVSDPADTEEIEATLPQLRHLLKKRLADAAANPGTRKRSA